jgi:hypothetical protein
MITGVEQCTTTGRCTALSMRASHASDELILTAIVRLMSENVTGTIEVISNDGTGERGTIWRRESEGEP